MSLLLAIAKLVCGRLATLSSTGDSLFAAVMVFVLIVIAAMSFVIEGGLAVLTGRILF